MEIKLQRDQPITCQTPTSQHVKPRARLALFRLRRGLTKHTSTHRVAWGPKSCSEDVVYDTTHPSRH